jgi:hypothetical protein
MGSGRVHKVFSVELSILWCCFSECKHYKVGSGGQIG